MSLSALPTVRFDKIAPAGFAILSALVQASSSVDLVITSGTDGLHSGEADPHHVGCAYDVRSHSFDELGKQQILWAVMEALRADETFPPAPADGGYVTQRFFGWLESAGTDDEHFHFQLRHGMSYP